MKCIECNGSGEINNNPYRESALLPDENKPTVLATNADQSTSRHTITLYNHHSLISKIILRMKFFLKNNKDKIHDIKVGVMWLCGLLGSIVTLFYISSIGQKRIDALTKAEQERKFRDGFVMVKYDDKGSVVNCWVVNDLDDIKLSDHSGSVACADRFNEDCVAWAANKLGADPKKCLR